MTFIEFIVFGARSKFWRELFSCRDVWPLCDSSIFGIFESRGGAVVRALASHQCGLGSFPACCHMWVEFVVGSRLAPRVFLHAGSPVFLPPQKPTSPNSSSTRMKYPHENQLGLILFPFL